MSKTAPADFIKKWQSSGGHERGSGQLFLIELCDLLGLPRPDPPQPETEHNSFVFERAVTRTKPDGSQTTVFIDLYKAGYFVLETKQGVNPKRDKHDPSQALLQGVDGLTEKKQAAGHGTRHTASWDKALEKAYEQARGYIRDLPAEEGIPPFLIVCDVGYVLELYADFSGTRGTYTPFPVAGKHRIYLKDLADEEKRQLLHAVFSDPQSLDPSKHAAKVTREVSTALARLATSLEKQKHHPEVIALFLQRCLFTLFAEDIGLLPANAFENLLHRLKNNHRAFPQFLTSLWKEMATGTDYSTVIQGEEIVKIPHFNGGLCDNPQALPLDGEQITLLLHAARQDWSEVEPAIFGTLLERALDPRDRHKLGAHYTPRSYVDRLVAPTLLQPLREQWNAAKTAAALHHAESVVAEA
ncbi:MAG: type IIL restriction-modification enzyme MmeI [Verrucomicrobiota bacterium]